MVVCELCGKTTELLTADIEGVELRVCTACAKYGTVRQRSLEAEAVRKPLAAQGPEFKVVDNYAGQLRAMREQRQMSHEDFAKLLNERESVVAKWEQGALKPSLDTAKKMGKVLGINLIEKDENAVVNNITLEKSKRTDEPTLGDMVKIRKRG